MALLAMRGRRADMALLATLAMLAVAAATNIFENPDFRRSKSTIDPWMAESNTVTLLRGQVRYDPRGPGDVVMSQVLKNKEGWHHVSFRRVLAHDGGEGVLVFANRDAITGWQNVSKDTTNRGFVRLRENDVVQLKATMKQPAWLRNFDLRPVTLDNIKMLFEEDFQPSEGLGITGFRRAGGLVASKGQNRYVRVFRSQPGAYRAVVSFTSSGVISLSILAGSDAGDPANNNIIWKQLQNGRLEGTTTRDILFNAVQGRGWLKVIVDVGDDSSFTLHNATIETCQAVLG